MAAFPGNRLAVCAAVVCAGAAYAQDEANEAIRAGAVEAWETDSFELDRSANTMVFEGFRIFGENWSLSADAATAQGTELEFSAGQWRFDGNVEFSVQDAFLQADSAVFAFADKQLVSAVLSGNPVTFEDHSADDDSPVRGTAQSLEFDNTAETFELRGRVALTVGPYRTTGCDLIYYPGQEEFTTGSQRCEERFRTVIVPQEPAATAD